MERGSAVGRGFWPATIASWVVIVADGRRAGLSGDFQGAACETDTPPPGDGGLPRSRWVLVLASRARECTGTGCGGELARLCGRLAIPMRRLGVWGSEPGAAVR